MLLIVIDDEDSQDQQSCQHAARNFRERMKIQERTDHRSREKSQRREDDPPTAERDIVREGFCGEDQFRAGALGNG